MSYGHLNLVLLGKTGAGKSAVGNTILGRRAFESKKNPNSVTRDVTVESGTVNGFPVTVYDTPGLCETELSEKKIQQMINEKVLQKCDSGYFAFLLVIKADRFTDEERQTVEKIEQLLGQNHLNKTWILFTRGDELEEENMTIKEFINLSEPLKKLVQKYDRRYHVFNNKIKKYTKQVNTLMAKISKTALLEGARLRQNIKNRLPRKVKQDTHDNLLSRKIVLLGKSGVGKSASGNTILGQNEFTSDLSMASVTSECSEKHATVSGRSVSVVDTPGFFDTQMKPEELMTEIAKSVAICSPGVHAFLIVFPVNNRFTEQEQQIADQVEIFFGEGVLKYSMVLFTHGDQLEGKSVEKLIEEKSRLRHLVQECGDRYHIFNNKDLNNRDQVNELLQKIDTMIEQNGGGYYINEMLEEAVRFRREEEERKLKQAEQQKSDKINKVIKETVKRTRAELEAQPKSWLSRFISEHPVYFHIAAFVLGGAAGGPVGAAAGAAAVGAAAGAAGGVIGVAIGQALNKD